MSARCEDCRFWIEDGTRARVRRDGTIPPQYRQRQGRCTCSKVLALVLETDWPVYTTRHQSNCPYFEETGSDGYVEVELVSQAYDEEKETIRVVRLRRDETIALQGNESIRSVRSDDG